MANDFFFGPFFEMFSLIIPMFIIMFIIMFIMMFYMQYIKNTRNKEKMHKKKDTIAFCFNDKINYEQIIFVTETSNLNRKKEEYAISDAQILSILTTFDKISIALKNNVYDETIIIEYYAKYFIHFYSIFRYFILTRRESSKNPDLFIEYEKLVRRWNDNSMFSEGGKYER